MRDDRAELLIGGRLYAGWTQVGVTRAMDAAAGAFNLTVSDRWSTSDQPWAIEPQDPCELRIGGEVMISGYVDLVRPSFSATDHSIQVQGRDKSADMIDCSAVHDPDEWRGINLLSLAQILGHPFGITATAETDIGGAFPLVKLQHGESALEALLRYAKTRKVMVMPDGRGGILLTRTGARRAAVELVQGRNILSASGTIDGSERYSDYLVKGQASYRADTDGEIEAHAFASVTDAYVGRYRPLLLVCDGEANSATAKGRATWEANTRIGRSAEASITVQGWRQVEGGDLWAPNMLVRVRSAWLSLDGEMLIRQVTFEKGSSGTTTTLELVSPQAYEPEPPDGKQKKGSSGGGNPWMALISEEVRRG